MAKFRFLLLDANIIIAAHEMRIWSQLVEKCELTIVRTVVEEAKYWEDNDGTQYAIDLSNDIKTGKVKYADVPLACVADFKQQFDSVYFDKLDPGEVESLTFMITSKEQWVMSSSDGIVFKVLGRLARGHQGISFEEVLEKIGLGRKVKRQYRKAFRIDLTKEGERDSITGVGMK